MTKDMIEFPVDENATIYVELQSLQTPLRQPGVQKTADVGETAQKISDNANQALSASMDTIHHMVRRVQGVVESINPMDRPTSIELGFGLSLDAEAGVAFLTKLGVGATMNVKLVWERDKIAKLNQPEPKNE